MQFPPLLPSYPLRDLRELLFLSEKRNSAKTAVASKSKGGPYQPTSYTELRAQVTRLAACYFDVGLQKGDRVAVLGENRVEWCLAYLATVAAGMVVVPIDRDLKSREIRHILNFAEPRLLVCAGGHLELVAEERSDIPALQTLVSMEEVRGIADLSFTEAMARGEKALRGGSQAFEEAQVEPDDVAAVIFTSGTTGNPKGVMLSHRNICSDIVATSEHVSVAEKDDVMLSVLPLHHTYECTGGFLMALYQGSTVFHAENLRRIPENLREAKATVMLGVPLLFEALYRRIEEGMKKKGEGKVRMAKRLATFSERVFRKNIRRAIFKEVHEKLGGSIRLLISGGAAINPAVSKGFRELGIDFIQGYGMTEASPIVAVNRINCLRDDSAGIPLPGVEVRIQEGEILVRGDIVMPGYFKNSEATAECLIDGWLHTGDLGYLKDGFLYINGRKKSVIVTPNGKNVYPEEVEGALNQSPFILESLVWGGPEQEQSKVEVQAIIVPDREGFDAQFGASKYDDGRIQQVVSDEVKRICQEMAAYKRVKSLVLRSEEFEKTTTKKIKRYLYTGKPRKVEASAGSED